MKRASTLSVSMMAMGLLVSPDVRGDDGSKSVKVYILAGQSNMVGIGQVTGGGSRWGEEFLQPVATYLIPLLKKREY